MDESVSYLLSVFTVLLFFVVVIGVPIFLIRFFIKRKKKNTNEVLAAQVLDENSVIEEHPNGPVGHEKEKLSLEDLSKEIIDFQISSFAEEELSEEFPDYSFIRGSHFRNLIDQDVLFEEAARLIVIHQQGSTSLIQRKFSIGYNRAGRLMDQLEAVGIVGATQGSLPREVFISDEYRLERLLNALNDGDNTSSFSPYSIAHDLRKEIRVKYKDSIALRKKEMEEEYWRMKKQIKEDEVERQKEVIRQEILEKERKRQLKREVRKELIESGHIQQNRRRESIPQDIQDKVWIRDGGKCVFCGSREHLEFDHIIPFSKGGSSTYRNIQLLCEKCNRQKSNNIG